MGVRRDGYQKPWANFKKPAIGKTWLIIHIFTLVFLVIALGIIANFIAEFNESGAYLSSQISWSLAVVTIALFANLLDLFVFFMGFIKGKHSIIFACLPDFLSMILYMVVSVVMANPLRNTDCSDHRSVANNVAGLGVSDMLGNLNDTAHLQATCNELKTIWVISIMLAVVYAFSCFVLGLLYLDEYHSNGDSGRSGLHRSQPLVDQYQGQEIYRSESPFE